MSLPPTYQTSIFNSAFFSNSTSPLTLDVADKRYLQLGGGSITGFLNVGGTLNASAFELNGTALTFNSIQGITAGTASASKALVVDASKNITGINSMSMASLTVNGVAITGVLPSQIDVDILNCTDYALITNTLDMGGQLTLTSGDVSVRSGDVVIDDGKRFILARNVNTKDINSSLYSESDAQLVVSSARGGGNILFETNKNGVSSTTYSYLFTDGTTSGIRRSIMAIYKNLTVKLGAITESTVQSSNIYWQLEVNRGIRSHGFWADSISYIGFGQQPKYMWNSQTTAGDSSGQIGIGPHDGTGNRTRIGLATYLTNPDDNQVCMQWASSGSGASMYAGSWNTFSDLRLKSDITVIEYGLDTVMQLNPVRYMLKHNQQEGYNLGLIAQEVLPIVPECVSTSGEENDREDSPVMMGIEYTQLVPILIKAVQEQQSLIKKLEELRLADQDRLNDLQLRLSRIETDLSVDSTTELS